MVCNPVSKVSYCSHNYASQLLHFMFFLLTCQFLVVNLILIFHNLANKSYAVAQYH